MTSSNVPTSHPALADLEREFGWTCWQDGDEYYARHPQTRPGDYDAKGDDPEDLRDAIRLVLSDTPRTAPAPQPATPHQVTHSMAAPAEPIIDANAEQADLETLGAELSALGCKTILTTGQDRQPRLDVLNPLAPTISKHIHAQADYFWWPTAEPIAPRTAIPAAANLIAHTLATTPITTRTLGRSQDV